MSKDLFGRDLVTGAVFVAGYRQVGLVLNDLAPLVHWFRSPYPGVWYTDEGSPTILYFPNNAVIVPRNCLQNTLLALLEPIEVAYTTVSRVPCTTEGC